MIGRTASLYCASLIPTVIMMTLGIINLTGTNTDGYAVIQNNPLCQPYLIIHNSSYFRCRLKIEYRVNDNFYVSEFNCLQNCSRFAHNYTHEPICYNHWIPKRFTIGKCVLNHRTGLLTLMGGIVWMLSMTIIIAVIKYQSGNHLQQNLQNRQAHHNCNEIIPVTQIEIPTTCTQPIDMCIGKKDDGTYVVIAQP